MAKADISVTHTLPIFEKNDSISPFQSTETYYVSPGTERQLLYVRNDGGGVMAVLPISFFIRACKETKPETFMLLKTRDTTMIVKRNHIHDLIRKMVNYYKKIKLELRKEGKRFAGKIKYVRKQKHRQGVGSNHSYA